MAVTQQQPTTKMPLRRTLLRHKRRRGEHLPARCLLTLAWAAVLITFFYGSKHSDSGAWASHALTFADQHSPAEVDAHASSFGFGELGHRHLMAVPPAPPAPCDDDKNSTSDYPPATTGMSDGAAITVQLIVMLFMFLGLAIVCDSFFEAALSRICEAMNLKDDVAGATWMAAGGSAPELATSVLGVFVSKSDVGFGTIVGSAVFNVLFVIAACAFVAPDLKLTWWPLARDCAYYCFAMSILVFVITDQAVYFYEALILLGLYAGYVTVMYFNESLEVWVTERVRLCSLPGNSLQQGLKKLFENAIFGGVLYAIIFANSAMVIAEMVDDSHREKDLPCYCGERQGLPLEYSVFWWINFAFNIFFVIEMLVKYYAYGFFGYWRMPLNCFDGALVFLIIVEFIMTTMGNASVGVGVLRTLRVLKFIRVLKMLRLLRIARVFIGTSTNDTQVVPADGPKDPQHDRVGEGAEKTKAVEGGDVKPESEPAAEEEEEDDDDEPFNPFEVPESMVGKFFWVAGFPLSLGMWLTIPDCRREMFKSWWPMTFTMCILWIGLLSYFMVWMVSEFGDIIGVPTTIMGITLLAAGTSIPDCLSSIAVARRGHGDMAVSSSIGSNIFDILIGLPIPWFIYGAVLQPSGAVDGEEYVPIKSDALTLMILLLFVMVASVITIIHICGWKLSVKLGAGMMTLYFLFLVLALLLEYDVIYGPC